MPVDARSPKADEPQEEGPMRPGGGTRDFVPVPDPTRLTTQLVDRALSAFREVVETRLDGLATAVELAAQKTDALPEQAAQAREQLYRRIESEMRAMRELLVEKIVNVKDVSAEQHTVLSELIDGNREVIFEKFQGINQQFMERDTRTEQAAQESRISLDAALAAAKEAVSEQNAANAKAIAKSEDATQKQIDANKTLMDTSILSLQNQINDQKVQLADINARKAERGMVGDEQRGAKATSTQSVGVYVALAGVAIVATLGIIGFIIDLVTR